MLAKMWILNETGVKEMEELQLQRLDNRWAASELREMV